MAFDNGSKFGMDRNADLGVGLLLNQAKTPIANVLAPQADHIGAPLSGVEQKRHCKPLPCARRVMRLELRNL
jgi:hypothetical protein